MSREKIVEKLLIFTLGLILLFNLTINAVYATDIDQTQTGSVTLDFKISNEEISGATFYIYKVADVSESGQPSLISPYRTYPIDIDMSSPEAISKTATTLEAYATYTSTPYITSGITDNNGSVTFDNLSTGVYLVSGEPVLYNDSYFKAVSTLATISQSDGDTSGNNVTVTCNSENVGDYYSPDSDDKTSISVYVVWNDAGYEDSRANSATIQLLQNNSVYDSVVLDETNDWSHEWSDLDKSTTWRVVETSNPGGYNLSIEQEGTSFTVTNTHTGTTSTASDEDSDRQPVINPPLATTEVNNSEPTTTTEATTNIFTETNVPADAQNGAAVGDESVPENIPQTGALQVSGIPFIAVGILGSITILALFALAALYIWHVS